MFWHSPKDKVHVYYKGSRPLSLRAIRNDTKWWAPRKQVFPLRRQPWCSLGRGELGGLVHTQVVSTLRPQLSHGSNGFFKKLPTIFCIYSIILYRSIKAFKKFPTKSFLYG